MELARQLKAKREERGLSQDEVSKAIFVSRQTISNWENDKTYPDVQSLLLLSQLFDVSIDELVRGDVVAMQQAIAVIENNKVEDIVLPCKMITKENMEEEEEFLIPIH